MASTLEAIPHYVTQFTSTLLLGRERKNPVDKCTEFRSQVQHVGFGLWAGINYFHLLRFKGSCVVSLAPGWWCWEVMWIFWEWGGGTTGKCSGHCGSCPQKGLRLLCWEPWVLARVSYCKSKPNPQNHFLASCFEIWSLPPPMMWSATWHSQGLKQWGFSALDSQLPKPR
jgi:hypothetical protein